MLPLHCSFSWAVESLSTALISSSSTWMHFSFVNVSWLNPIMLPNSKWTRPHFPIWQSQPPPDSTTAPVHRRPLGWHDSQVTMGRGASASLAPTASEDRHVGQASKPRSRSRFCAASAILACSSVRMCMLNAVNDACRAAVISASHALSPSTHHRCFVPLRSPALQPVYTD